MSTETAQDPLAPRETAEAGNVQVGTSGFSYSAWKGNFYPESLPPKGYLAFYAQHFLTTEINSTFYRSPSSKVTSGWAQQVPDRFRFSLKLNRRITHQKRLADVQQEMEWFFKGGSPLGAKLGTLLVQLPPYFKENQPRLEAFLKEYSSALAFAFEFRHPSWFCEATYHLLERHGAALVIAEADEQVATRVVTAPFLYLRLRRSHYSQAELQGWADWILAQNNPGVAYLKHDKGAPRLARTLQQALQG